MPTFLDNVDFSKTEARNLVTHQLASAPASPVRGLRYYDTTLNKEGVYNGTSWDYAGSGGVTAIAATAPITSTGGSTPTIAISPASGSTAGSISISDFNKLAAATAVNTVSTIVLRDSSGNVAFGTATGALTGTASNASNLNSQTPAFYLGRANHTGSQTSATISDFDTQVRSSRLDQFAAPTSAVPLGSQRITALAPPSIGTDAVNKDYADALISTGNNKGTARLAATGNITIASPGATIDSVTAANGDVILLPGQTTGSQNNLYIFNGAASPLTLATNADISAEVRSGLFVFVSEGTVNGSNGFTLTTPNPIALGTTALTFTQTSGAGQITSGTGLTKSGNILNVGAGAGILANADDVAIDTTVVARKYAQTIGDGTTAAITVTHSLNNLGPIWGCSQVASPFTSVMPTVTFPTANTATFTFSAGNIPTTNQYRVTLIG